jgi:hypothetical protein
MTADTLTAVTGDSAVTAPVSSPAWTDHGTVHAPYARRTRWRACTPSTATEESAGQAITAPYTPYTHPSVHARTPL